MNMVWKQVKLEKVLEPLGIFFYNTRYSAQNT